MSPNQDAALALASMGFHIFPCKPDKVPTIVAWEQNATNNTLKIEATWKGSPHLLPAIPIGAHGLLVFDADKKPNGTDGVAAFHALCLERGIDLSCAFVVDTPSGGQHFYWRTETPYGNSRGSLPDGIDVRGIGGYCIAPGATLQDGRCYRITAGTWDTIPPLPASLAGLFRAKQPTRSPETTRGTTDLTVTWRERAFAEAALADEVSKLKGMGKGAGRNAALNQAAHSLGTMEGWIDLNIVYGELLQASIDNGYAAKDGEAATKRTIESGIEAGRSKPRSLLASDISEIDMSAMITNGIAAYKRKHSEPSSAASRKRSVTVLQGSQIQEQRIEWLWPGYLPVGKLTLLAGEGGTGKSTIAFNLAATITNGGNWPDGSCCYAAGNVLIWSSEDDAADTIKPRLMAAGANQARYGIISGIVDERNESESFDPSRDIALLRDAILQMHGVSLLIIDPIVSAVTGDMNKTNDVRRGLQAIVDLAGEMRCAVLGITHFTKNSAKSKPSDRIIGSTGFKDLARMNLVAVKDEESNRRALVRAKTNISDDIGGFSYFIEVLSLHSGIVTTRVVWDERLEGSARSILAEYEGDNADTRSPKLFKAKSYLIERLKNGSATSKELFEEAAEVYGIKADTLTRAKEALAIAHRKLGMNGGWVWELPVSIIAR